MRSKNRSIICIGLALIFYSNSISQQTLTLSSNYDKHDAAGNISGIEWITKNNNSNGCIEYKTSTGSRGKLALVSFPDDGNHSSWTAFDDLSAIAYIEGNETDSTLNELINGDQPKLTVNPLVLDYGWTLNSLELVITNDGDSILNWTAEENPSQEWIVINHNTGIVQNYAVANQDKSLLTIKNSTSGSLEPGQSAYLQVVVDREGLYEGSNYGEILVTSNGGDQAVDIIVEADEPPIYPILYTNPKVLDFNISASNLKLIIKNRGVGTLSWSAYENPDKSWITSISPSSSSLESMEEQEVTVSVDRSALNDGSYFGTISINSSAGKGQVEVELIIGHRPAVTRANVGGYSYTDHNNNLFFTDRPYREGAWGAVRGHEYKVADDIANTQDDILYQTVLFWLDAYRFDVENGSYTVKLHFAELYYNYKGGRVFDVTIENNLVLDHFDIYANAGFKTATSRTFSNIAVNDRRLDIDFTHYKAHALLSAIEIISDPKITVISPNGGEDWEVLSDHDITWTSQNTSGTVKIEYSTDGGSNWMLITSSTPDSGNYSWSIPDSTSTNCLVRITDTDGNPSDQSDAAFTISTAPLISVTSPNGGENWEADSDHNITWNSHKTSGNVQLDYSSDNGSNWIEIITSTEDDGTYSWTIPDNPSTNCLVKITDTDGVPSDVSDDVFAISPSPFISVTTPNGGEDWEVGSVHDIRWTSQNTSGNVQLQYSPDNGISWKQIIASTPDNRMYSWTIPDDPSTNCLIKVTDSDGSPSDLSDAVFTLSQAPFITVIAPNGGENWEIDSLHDITWNSNQTSGAVKLEYSTNNGSNWIAIIDSTEDDGTYLWTIPDQPSTNCLLRVTDVDGDPSDVSDANFTISTARFITIITPNGGENWQIDSIQNITWNSNQTSGTVKLEFSVDTGANWTEIIASTEDDGSYSWIIPNNPSANCLVRVADTDGEPSDTSDAVFTISPSPFITVTAPNGGEDWEVGSVQTIIWNSNKTSGTLKLEYSTDNGTVWKEIVTSTEDDGSYLWTIPDDPSATCLIKITDTDGSLTDQSDAVFTISAAASIAITAPFGGEDWEVGSVHNITWTSNKTSGNIKIEYSIDNGLAWKQIIVSTPDSGSYSWTIPDDPSTTCLVRVTDIDGSPSGASDAVFAISQTPFITVISPNGGEIWAPGTAQDITWKSNKTSGTVKLEYSTVMGTNWIEIIASTEDDGIYSWTIPDNPSTNCLVRTTDTDGNPSDISDAVFTIIQQAFAISGSVAYYGTGKLVSNVIIDLTHSAGTGKDTTDMNGEYLFDNVPPGDVAIVPLKTDDWRDAITGSDALLVLRCLAFLVDMNSDQKAAADVTNDSNVTGSDAVAILRYLAFYSNNIGITGQWRLVPADIRFVLDADTAADFRGYLKGDANLNWGQGARLSKSTDDAAVSLNIAQAHVAASKTIIVPIELETADQPFHTLELSLSYDAGCMRYRATEPTALTEQFITVANGDEPGKIHIAMAGVAGIERGGEILRLIFEVVEKKIAIDLNIGRAFINDGEVTKISRGHINFEDIVVTAIPEHFSLDQNYPNPFNPETIISFRLPEATHVILKVYNLLGDEICTLIDENKAAGYCQVIWNGKNSLGQEMPSGIYFFKIEAGNFRMNRKMVKIQ